MPLSQGGYEAGLSAATGILAALLAREKTGKGQFIDISEVEVWATTHAGQYVLTFLYRGITGIRRGTHGPQVYPCEIFPAKMAMSALSRRKSSSGCALSKCWARQAGPKSPATATAAPWPKIIRTRSMP